jgi:hypothetical protein
MPRILIVDDDRDWRERDLVDPIAPLRYDIHKVRERPVAMTKLSSEAYDLVVLNVKLVEGIQVGQIVPQWVELMGLAQRRGVEVIVVSAPVHAPTIRVDKLMRMAFKDYGVADFFAKDDFDQAEYSRAVQQAVKDHQTPDLPLPNGFRQEFVDRLSNRIEWLTSETDRRAFLIGAGFGSAYVHSLPLSGAPATSATTLIAMVGSLGSLVTAPKYCPLGLIARHVFFHAVAVDERDFFAQLVLRHRLTTDLNCLDALCKHLHARGL